MPYSDFTIRQAQHDFSLEIVEKAGIFSTIKPAQTSDVFSKILEENIPLAVSINTEKARSELIIANVLLELRRIFDKKISFFSGVEFNVDKERGLNGFCDFLISRSPEQLFVKAPVIAIVEAKNENIMSGIGQCIAEMVAAKQFNEQDGGSVSVTYGAVTSGTAWKFLKMNGSIIHFDLKDYNLDDMPGRIIGILAAMIEQKA
jgi:hypothetical protein